MHSGGFVIDNKCVKNGIKSEGNQFNLIIKTSIEEEKVKDFVTTKLAKDIESANEIAQENTSDLKVTDLKRELGLMSCISFVVGCIIGSGIFITPNGALKFSGSVASSLIVWISSGVLSYLGAICYLELGTMLPFSGGEYSYFLRGYGNLVAYSYSWMSIFLLKPVQLAVDAKILGTYVIQPFIMNKEYSETGEILLIQLVALAVLIIVALINCISVKLAVRIQILSTVTKVTAITFIIFVGFIRIGQGYTENLTKGFKPISHEYQFSIGQISKGLFYGLWTYNGWNTISLVTEEIKNPQKNLTCSILFGIPFVIVIYFMTNVTYLTALSPIQIINSTAVAVEWSDVALGEFFDDVQVLNQIYPFFIPILVSFSCFGSANGNMFASARLIFVASRQGHMMKIFSYIQAKTLTPAPAVILIASLSILINFSFEISVLINIFSVIIWFFYGLAFGVVIVLRIREHQLVRPIKVWFLIPVLMVVISGFLVFSPIIEDPQLYYLNIFVVYAVGVIFYFVCVYKHIEPKWLIAINRFVSASFNLVSP